MSEWMPPGLRSNRPIPKSLQAAVGNLSPKAKQAFYAAAMRTEIARGTWNGCAFNAGGLEIGLGDSINSFQKAAEAFEMPAQDVRTFITAWDNSEFSTDALATARLKQLLEDVGLFSEPGGKKTESPVRTFVVTLHESDATIMKREFDAMVKDIFIDDVILDEDKVEFKSAIEAAQELLHT